ncbi:metallophosphoesterase [bacterium AH-315-E10]|nr:metallophosphoesterase [bacterium AH-315-E10]
MNTEEQWIKCDVENRIDLRINSVTQPFVFLHITDLHLCECDDRDAGMQVYLGRRRIQFNYPERQLERILKQIHDVQPDFVAVTGDLIDSPTKANIEAIQGLVEKSNVPFYFALGNHEWSNLAVRHNQSHWQEALKVWTSQDLDWFTVLHKGVHLLFINNSNYQFSADQLEQTKRLFSKGEACVVFCHIPVLMEVPQESQGQLKGSAILVGSRENEKLIRRIHPSTVAFCSLLKTHQSVMSVFAGHVHEAASDAFRDGVKQYICPPAYLGKWQWVSVGDKQ